MNNRNRMWIAASLALTMLAGCAASSSNREAAAAGIAALKARGIPEERAGQKFAVIPMKKAFSSETLLETENTKPSDAKVSASVSSSRKNDTTNRPNSSDFDWVSRVSKITDVPDGAKKLTKPEEIGGEWKAMMIGNDNDYYYFSGLLNLNLRFDNKEDVTVIADWYRSTEINKQTGETRTYDETVDADTVYRGSLMPDSGMYAYDPVEDKYSRHLFVSGERIRDLFIINWYEKNGKQYALGMFNSENEWLGTLALVRNSSDAPGEVPVASKVTPEWAQFEGYWKYESENDPNNDWDDEDNSIYIRATDKDHAFVFVSDEMWGECIYDKKRVEYDPKTNTIRLYNIEDKDLDNTMHLETSNGKEILKVDGADDMEFRRRDKADRTWLSWDSVEEDFREVENYYAGRESKLDPADRVNN